jgi:hypothetical protein
MRSGASTPSRTPSFRHSIFRSHRRASDQRERALPGHQSSAMVKPTSSILLRTAQAQHPPGVPRQNLWPGPGPVGIDRDKSISLGRNVHRRVAFLLPCVTATAVKVQNHGQGVGAGSLRWNVNDVTADEAIVPDVNQVAARGERVGGCACLRAGQHGKHDQRNGDAQARRAIARPPVAVNDGRAPRRRHAGARAQTQSSPSFSASSMAPILT